MGKVRDLMIRQLKVRGQYPRTLKVYLPAYKGICTFYREKPYRERTKGTNEL